MAHIIHRSSERDRAGSGEQITHARARTHTHTQDAALILDVWPASHPAYWVPLPLLWYTALAALH